MMIVVGIMLMLVTAAATMMPSATESRRIRESARMVNVYLSTARNRAMATGRPCGVTFHCLSVGAIPCALNADQCEVPPCYCGETDASAATVQWTSGTLTTALVSDTLTTGMVRVNDLIQFNCQGPMYKITGPDAGSGNVTGGSLTLAVADANQNTVTPWPSGTPSPAVPYRIFRSPTKGGTTPLQLPATTVVDLDFSSSGTKFSNPGDSPPGYQDLTVLFSPTGAVDSVYYAANRSVVTDPIYILIGKRERVGTYTTPPPPVKLETQLSNAEDLNNLWVTINAQTGMVNTEPVAADIGAGAASVAYDFVISAGGTPTEASKAANQATTDGAARAVYDYESSVAHKTDAESLAAAKLAAMNSARTLAGQARGMGGK
jgi:hypothetical protein